MPAELFRCHRCGKLYDRSDFTKGMTSCSCDSKRFERAGKIGLIEELVFAARHPKLTWAELRGR